MAVKLIDPISAYDEIFNLAAFNDADGGAYFSLINEVGSEIRVNYIPLVDSAWGPENLEVFLFDNPYLNAENDVFEVYESSLQERIGWIFPITILVSNDNEYSNFKNLNKYKYVAYYRLLNDGIRILDSPSVDDSILITDLYSDSSVICVLNRETTQRIDNFNIDNYILSFYKYGYSLLQENSLRAPILSKEEFVKEMRQSSRRRINLKKSEFILSSNSFIDSLFRKYLLKTDDFLVRFIFLYQVIEQLMEDEFSLLFEVYLSDYNNHHITKNDFKDYLNTSSKERDLIKSVFKRTNIETYLKDDFERVCGDLFNDINLKTKNSLPDKIYDFRNLITHSYRNILDKEDYVSSLVQIFEDIIICALINYNNSSEQATEMVA